MALGLISEASEVVKEIELSNITNTCEIHFILSCELQWSPGQRYYMHLELFCSIWHSFWLPHDAAS